MKTKTPTKRKRTTRKKSRLSGNNDAVVLDNRTNTPRPRYEKAYSTKKIVLIGLAILATGGLAYGGYKYYKKKKEDKALNENNTPSKGSTGGKKFDPILPPVNNGGGGNSGKNPNFPLKKGSNGDYVQKLQKYLISKGQSLASDGNFGTITQTALVAITGKDSITEAEFNALIGGTTIIPGGNTTGGNIGKTIIGGTGFAVLQHIDSVTGKQIPGDSEMFNPSKEIGVCYKEDNLYYYVIQTSGNLWNRQKKGYVFKAETTAK